MHWSKTILTSLLLAVFCLPLLSPIYLQLQQQYTRWQMRESLEKKELVKVYISPSAIQWIRDGKECVINGEMFDVKEMHSFKNQIVLTGLYDQKEKAIKNKLSNQTQSQQDSKNIALIVKLFPVFNQHGERVEMPEMFYVLIGKNEQPYCNFCSTPFIGIHTPPPRLLA